VRRRPRCSAISVRRRGAEGDSLAEVLRRYPGAVRNEYRGKPVRPFRRAIHAHYALLQELHGEPDVDPADSATAEQIISEEGIEWARVRTGSGLTTKYRNDWPNLGWYGSQAPDRWTTAFRQVRWPHLRQADSSQRRNGTDCTLVG
jgi:hypothetical protein